MQEREMRERVESFLKLRLRKNVMPAALGLGLALTDCRSQVPPDAGPAATAQPEAAEPIGDLLRPDGVAIYSAPVTVGPGAPPKDRYRRLEWTANLVWSAIQSCDRSFLRGSILSRAELALVTTEIAPDEVTYQKMVDEWIERAAGPFCTSPPPGISRHLGGVQIKDMLVFPADSQWKRPVMIGLVTAHLFTEKDNMPDRDPRKIGPVRLLDHADRWRILVKK